MMQRNLPTMAVPDKRLVPVRPDCSATRVAASQEWVPISTEGNWFGLPDKVLEVPAQQ